MLESQFYSSVIPLSSIIFWKKMPILIIHVIIHDAAIEII